jgi:hypothetical protein
MSTFGGSFTNRFTPAARPAARDARQARSNEKAIILVPIMRELRAAGLTTLNERAEANARGILTPGGGERWYAIRVSRLLTRLGGKVR